MQRISIKILSGWKSHLVDDVELVNVSSDIAQLALQGPLAEKVLQKLTKNLDLSEMDFLHLKMMLMLME